jgi:hypothetical protein
VDQDLLEVKADLDAYGRVAEKLIDALTSIRAGTDCLVIRRTADRALLDALAIFCERTDA